MGAMPPPVSSPRAARLAALVIALVVGAACFVGGTGDGTDQGAPGAPRPDATEFAQDMQGAAGSAQEYWQAQFATAGRRFQPIRRIIPYRQEGEVECGGTPLPRNNAVYCPAGDFMAYDVNWAAVAFTKLGDAFVYYLLGHEYAHGIQVRLGLRYEYTIQQELQADCMAGAYIGDSIRQGQLTLEEGDLDELRTGLAAVGDDPDQPWFAPGAHGTAEERTDAFFAGYEGSLAPCKLPLTGRR